MASSTNIKVVCRFRPPNAIEAREGGEICVTFDDNLQTVQLRSAAVGSGPEKDGFTFDRVFPMGTKQAEVFDYGVKEIVKDVLDGYNGTVFAYGQTGSGKTFTMMGADIDSEELKGIIPRITEQIFQSIVESDAHLEYLVKVSYMEIYLERIRDLLAPQNDNLQVHEEKSKGVYVKGLSDYYVSSAREVYEIMRTGGAARIVSSTNMNAESSRSHSIFLITIQQRNTETGAQKTGNLYLVDLAGSEKVGKTGASGQTLEEAKKINKSLSALGMVINALTDGKAKHIPYRDSKLTRILQESLGGNSRTTLIINCSPSSYNEAETLSTLRFGIRAKSIKNTARVNAELSPLELKGLLAKANLANTGYQKYISALEAELAIWRSGGKVEESEWATSGKVAAASLSVAPRKAPTSPTPSTPLSMSRSLTPVNPAIESLRGDLESRPQTPTVIGLEKDEREEFLRRENELSDQLAEKESLLNTAEKLVKELRDELTFLKEQEASVNKDNKTMSSQLNELRLQVERLNYDNKEGSITIDILKEQNQDAKSELEELKKQILELKTMQKDATAEDKEKRKQEKMAMMMAKFDTQGAFSEKDEQLRQILIKLDSIDTTEALTPEDLTIIRRQLSESQSIIRETVDRLRQSQEENEMATRRRDELEARVMALETEYEELLEKTIHDEETSDVDLAESMAELKAKLEAQYAAKRDAHLSEVQDLKQQLELKGNEVRSLNASIDSLKSVNEELKRAFAVTSAGIEGGKNLAESAQDLERTRKAINVQLAEFDGVKKSLMRDLQNRCEKVVELEIQLDEMKEQYNNVIRNSNSKAQQKKMAFLERNLEQLTLVQKQLVDQNSSLKKEAGIAERKLLARNERIQNLEALLQDADRRLSIQNQKFEAQLQAVKERLDQARAQKAANGTTLSFGRIAKPLRGGGGTAAAGATPAAIGGGIGAGNPALARLQSDEG
ncbi:Kinesin heavy chain [Termitomyces sp. J132]|nr:Kinesin heavy chain [Termitomyces sp. J132]